MILRSVPNSRRPAVAYLDAGTASLILQFVAAGIFGALLVTKTFWYKIKEIISGVMTWGRKTDA